MAFCTNCGHRLADGEKFCTGCGIALEAVQNKKEKRTIYDGEIHKCPNCGEHLDSFTTVCPSCNYELRGTQTASRIHELAQKLEKVKTMESKAELISNFYIPNTREDIYEFFILAYSNITAGGHGAEAWNAKLEQAYLKAQFAFGNNQEFAKIQELYDAIKKLSTRKRNEKTRRILLRASVCLVPIVAFVALIIGLIALISTPYDAAQKENIEENARLEAIVEEVYSAIEAEDYVMARAKAATLVFSVHNGYEKEYVEIWDLKRENLMKVIDEAENKNHVAIPGVSMCVDFMIIRGENNEYV